MPKKKLTEIAKEYELTFEEAQDIVLNCLVEEMVTGRGKNTWISEGGQSLFDDLVPIDVIYRAKVLHQMPNPKYVSCYIRELSQKVNVEIPLRFTGQLTGKIIHIEANNKNEKTQYVYRKPKMV
tara:strand:- start:6951 stop:7322 length:372 start_codon:yes stop_codon:yes gene_type:complete